MEQSKVEALNVEDLAAETALELPARHLLATVSVLGLPLLGVSDVAVNINTGGPGWVIGS
jgi:hypothetical protein